MYFFVGKGLEWEISAGIHVGLVVGACMSWAAGQVVGGWTRGGGALRNWMDITRGRGGHSGLNRYPLPNGRTKQKR